MARCVSVGYGWSSCGWSGLGSRGWLRIGWLCSVLVRQSRSVLSRRVRARQVRLRQSGFVQVRCVLLCHALVRQSGFVLVGSVQERCGPAVRVRPARVRSVELWFVKSRSGSRGKSGFVAVCCVSVRFGGVGS